jgi:hypothetical protein
MAMSKNRDDRELAKFIESFGGETAVRVIIADSLGTPLVKSKYYIDSPISALKIVRFLDKDTIAVADADANDLELSKGFGITLQGGPTGSYIEVGTFGKVEDAFFNFPLGAPLYLGANGSITTTPHPQYLLPIGEGAGAGAIFINIGKPILRR